MFSYCKSLFERAMFCYYNLLTTVGKSICSFIDISFTSFWHRFANLTVDKDSSSHDLSMESVAIITVLQLPPSESRRMDVIKEFLYGICSWLPADFLINATITYSRYDSDLLIYLASFFILDSGSVLYVRSLPAKSTKFNLHDLYELFSMSLMLIYSVKIQWDRLDRLFIGVEETLRI